jgi:hypothetical protein
MHDRQASRKSQEAMREWDTATVAQLILFPCLPYLLWAVLYYIKVSAHVGLCKGDRVPITQDH